MIGQSKTIAGKTILVADDEQNIRLALRTSLETDGFAVREATSSDDAIEQIDHDHPDLVLLDLWMPGDGMTVLEHLNQQPPDERPRVIILTAHGRVPIAVKAMQLGASDFLEKPTTPEDLRLSIAAALEAVEEKSKREGKTPAPANKQINVDPVLGRIRQAVWNQDIHVTENILSALFRKARDNPLNFNLLGAVFEAEGNIGAARTFYSKAYNADPAFAPARHNLQRLEDIEAGIAEIAIVDLRDQETLLENIIGVMKSTMPHGRNN